MPYYRNQPQPILTLAEALQAQTVDSLKKLAPVLSREKAPTRKAELIIFIQRHLEGSELRSIWDQLDELQQAAVADVVHGEDPYFHADRFVAKYGRQPNWGERINKWGYSYLAKPSLLAAFFYDGVMPADLRRQLSAFVPPPRQTQLNIAEEPPKTLTLHKQRWNAQTRKSEPITEELSIERREMEYAAAHDLQAVLQLIDLGKVAVSDKTRLPGAATTRAVSELLLGGDYYDDNALAERHKFYEKVGPIRAFAWPVLVQASGLAELSGKQLRLSKAGQKALNAPVEKTIRTLWKRWLKTTLLDELSRIDVIKGQGGKGKRGLTAVKGRREAINAALAECPPGRWVAVDELFRYMRATGMDFEVTRDPWKLYVTNPNYGSLGYEGFHGWHILQARYALCLLFEYAATLGLIDVAYTQPHHTRPDYGDVWGTDDLEFFSRYDGLLYFRLTPLGAYCLDLAADYTPAAPKQRPVLRVLPNLEIVATSGPLSAADELLLDSYTERKADVQWHLEQDKLLAALEEGKTVAALREFLEARSSDPLPETVIRFLKDMEDRTTRLQDKGLARLIECADPALATLIANDTRTKNYCLLAGERHLAVFADAETRFRNALRKLGYSLPK